MVAGEHMLPHQAVEHLERSRTALQSALGRAHTIEFEARDRYAAECRDYLYSLLNACRTDLASQQNKEQTEQLLKETRIQFAAYMLAAEKFVGRKGEWALPFALPQQIISKYSYSGNCLAPLVAFEVQIRSSLKPLLAEVLVKHILRFETRARDESGMPSNTPWKPELFKVIGKVRRTDGTIDYLYLLRLRTDRISDLTGNELLSLEPNDLTA